jgi:hypothetical protein
MIVTERTYLTCHIIAPRALFTLKVRYVNAAIAAKISDAMSSSIRLSKFSRLIESSIRAK